MMTAEQLMGALLEYAMQGNLVPQKIEDGSSKELLQIIQTNKNDLIRKGELRSNKKESFIYSEEGHFYDQIGKKVTCIDDEIPFEIPMTWCWKRLENVAYMSDGVHFAPKYVENGIPCFSAKDVYGDEIHTEKCNYITRTDYEEMREKINVKKNSVLVTKSGTIGRTAVVHDYFEFGLVESIGVINSFGVDADYIKLLLDYGFWYTGKYYSQYTNGIAVKHLTLSLLGKVLIPIPPLAEQKRIVAKIEELMPFVERYAAASTKLNTLNTTFPEMIKKSILQEAVQGKLVPQDPNDEPASLLLKKIAEEKKRLIKEGKIKAGKKYNSISEEEIAFDIPETWMWARLSDVVFNRGQKKPENTFSYIDIGSIDNVHQKLNDEENIIKPENAPSRARKIVASGDVIYSTVRPYLHNMCIIDREFSHEPIASTGFAAMTCHEGLYNKYLFYFLLSPDFDRYANDTENSKGVAYPAINDQKLYKALVPIPPLNEQKRIVAKIEELMSFVDDLKY